MQLGAPPHRDPRLHNRADFPDLDRRSRVTSAPARGDGTTVEEPVPNPSHRCLNELREWLDRPWDVALAGRLLE